jgi:hypothetical protein
MPRLPRPGRFTEHGSRKADFRGTCGGDFHATPAAGGRESCHACGQESPPMPRPLPCRAHRMRPLIASHTLHSASQMSHIGSVMLNHLDVRVHLGSHSVVRQLASDQSPVRAMSTGGWPYSGCHVMTNPAPPHTPIVVKRVALVHAVTVVRLILYAIPIATMAVHGAIRTRLPPAPTLDRGSWFMAHRGVVLAGRSALNTRWARQSNRASNDGL